MKRFSAYNSRPVRRFNLVDVVIADNESHTTTSTTAQPYTSVAIRYRFNRQQEILTAESCTIWNPLPASLKD